MVIKTIKHLIKRILAYSAIKRIAKPPEEYSILKPETNSDSPSAKSKGERLVSANLLINHLTAKGKISIINQIYI
jgi:hypothetical protein